MGAAKGELKIDIYKLLNLITLGIGLSALIYALIYIAIFLG